MNAKDIFYVQRLVIAFGFALLATGSPSYAEFIQPVAVQVSNGTDTQDALINGNGFDVPGVGSPASIHSRDSAEMWSAVGSIKESAIFDLGNTVNLTKIYIWNYNVVDATDVGMKDAEVLVSADLDIANTNANFNAIARITLKEGGDTAQVFSVAGTGVRLVKIKGISNWGQGYTVGLAEVRFESGDITGNVPTIVLNSPRDGDEIAFGAAITIDAKVTDKDNDLQKVEFYDGDTLVTNRTASPFTAVLNGATKGDHALRVMATDKTGKSAWVTANVFVRELVADRIVKIDDTADEGDGLNQIKYTGTWTLAQGVASDPRYLNNDHYESANNKNDYFEVRFKGVKIDVFATVASHHGTGMASIDGGPESKANYKATQRAEQVLVWSSPILPNREHVLKIRVYGDGVVTADRFDVSVSDKPEVTTATIKEVLATLTNLVVTMEDITASVVVPTSIKLSIDSAPVAASVAKVPPITTIKYAPPAPFLPGSTHDLRIEAKDTAGVSITNESTFTLPAPFFPLTGLGGPVSAAGQWGFRQIWNVGRVDAVVSAVDAALKANQPGFTGTVHDATVPFINLALTANPGTAGLFPDDQPLPAEAKGLSPSDFVIVARAKVKIPRSGDWTIGVHSDEGFALRFIGAPFDSVSGNGMRDDNFPEYMAFLTTTADSSTRGILKGIAAGTYEIEFIAFQRVAAAFYEVYAAEGAFVDDTESDQWQLIGAPSGLEIVSGTKLTANRLTKVNDKVTIEFASPEPDGQHQLQESIDLKSWQPVTAVTFEKAANNAVRASVTGVGGDTRFYRMVLLSKAQ